MMYQLKYHLKVQDLKYRELMNVLENVLNKHKPAKCSNRRAFQSVSDMHVFIYMEVWKDIVYLREYLNSNEFKSLRGAFELLTVEKDFSIVESKELEESTLLDNQY